MGTMKTCKCCGKEKELHEFVKEKRNKDGRGANCKKCQSKISNAKYYPLVRGFVVPRAVMVKENRRTSMIVKYGIAVVEAMEDTNFDDL